MVSEAKQTTQVQTHNRTYMQAEKTSVLLNVSEYKIFFVRANNTGNRAATSQEKCKGFIPPNLTDFAQSPIKIERNFQRTTTPIREE